MAAVEELGLVRLREDYHRDGFKKVLTALIMMAGIMLALLALSLLMWFKKPNTVYFVSDNDWHVIIPVPLDKPYLKTPDLLQWVSTVLPSLFTYDFVNFNDQLNQAGKYFTPDGLRKFQDQITTIVTADQMQRNKLFINTHPEGAPIILNQGLLGTRYGWWVQMPMNISYSTFDKNNIQYLTVQALIVRVPTTDNFYGVSIDNIIITKSGV